MVEKIEEALLPPHVVGLQRLRHSLPNCDILTVRAISHLTERSDDQPMETMLTALELTGMIDEHHHLRLDTALTISGPKRVRVIVLYSPIDEWDDDEWLRAAARNPAFDFLREPEEDIYTLADGHPFHDAI